MSERRLNVFTDGACLRNGQCNPQAGIGVWCPSDKSLNTSQRLGGRQTNNRAELHAAITGIMNAMDEGYSKVRINTDSAYVVNCMNNWQYKWFRNGFINSKGGPVANKDDIIVLSEISDQIDTEFVHIPRERNTQADALARYGAQLDY